MRFGLATLDITPNFPTNLYGYSGRVEPYHGVYDRLQCTVLILEECGTRVVIGTADLGTFPNDARTFELRQRVARIAECPVDHVLLNASHSHGSVYQPASSELFFSEFDHAASERYFTFLGDRIAAATEQAIAQQREGTLRQARGRTTMPINRRRMEHGEIRLAPNPGGPIDGAMDLLVLHDEWGRLAAVGMRVGCHPVSTGPRMLLSADFIGAWRRAAAAELGAGVQTFFMQGAGGDARPRQTVTTDGTAFRQLEYHELESIGQQLCAEMKATLMGPSRVVGGVPFKGTLRVTHAQAALTYTNREQLAPLLQSDNVQEQRFAQACLKLLDAGKPIPTSVPCQVQTLWLDRELAIVGLDNEPLCAVGQAIEQAFAPHRAMVLGYCNGSIGYAPDTHELGRGGYESRGYLYEPWAGPFVQGFEKVIVPALDRSAPSFLANQT